MRRHLAPVTFVALCCLPVQAAEEPVAFFESRIRPILVDRCGDCHGSDKQKGDLRLDSKAGWMHGGQSGQVIVPGKPDDSLLITAVRYWNKDLQMPPKHALDPEEVKDLIEWVKLGAPDPREAAPEPAGPKKPTATFDLAKARQHWSFQPVKATPPPAVKDAGWVRNDVDRFTLAAMEKAGVHPAPDADPATLIRRLTYDLTGLPPTPEEVEVFARDSISNQPSAISNLVDRLLASPRYGERWGRHWLDVVRYADTCGNASDYPIPQAYKYRNYVIQAFNDDMPFDQFVREQIAGDLLPAKSEDEREHHIVATGYLAGARHFAGGAGEPHLTIGDAIDNLSQAFLGLSVSCARCHDHKFDPILTRDYYALYGILSSTAFPHPGSEGMSRPARLVPLVAKDEAAKLEKARADQLAALDAEAKAATAAKAVVEKEADTPERKPKLEAAAKVEAEAKKKRKDLGDQPLYPTAYAVSEGKGANAKLQVRGDPGRLGEEVPRGFPLVLGGQTLPDNSQVSGRLELAQWITDAKNPLTARVFVNRLWEYHFGRGLVATPNDFGARGQAPTNPELLDFLADRFVQSGYSIKAMHRLLLLSHTWQLASQGATGPDPSNALWSRAERARLDAESIRDTLLYVGGDLDFTPGGEHPFPPAPTWSFTQHKQFFATYETKQRSVYQMQQRLRKHPFFGLFDGADTNSSTAVRPISTTPLQSLFAMNDPFMHERAGRLATRLAQLAPEDSQRLDQAFLTLYARHPSAEETSMARDYLVQLTVKKQIPRDQAWASLCRVLLSANEFLYLD